MQEQLPRDVFEEPTWMYSWRVSGGRYPCRGDQLALCSKNPHSAQLDSLWIRRQLGVTPKTRREPIHGGSAANFLFAKALGVTPNPLRIVRDGMKWPRLDVNFTCFCVPKSQYWCTSAN